MQKGRQVTTLYQIKPCPFCGESPSVKDTPVCDEEVFVYCKSCNFMMKATTFDDLLMRWNKRKDGK